MGGGRVVCEEVVGFELGKGVVEEFECKEMEEVVGEIKEGGELKIEF